VPRTAAAATVAYFIEYFKAGLEAGGTRPAWPDTVGTLTPEATRWYCSRIVGALPQGLPIVAHLHNDYGLGTVNAITAVSSGFKVVSVTANGYGERAGNVKLHEFVVALRVLYGIELPGSSIRSCASWRVSWSAMSGIPLQQHEPIVGSKVFAHESGIHTQAMLIRSPDVRSSSRRAGGRRHELGFGKHTAAALSQDTLRRHAQHLARAGGRAFVRPGASRNRRSQRLREDRAARARAKRRSSSNRSRCGVFR